MPWLLSGFAVQNVSESQRWLHSGSLPLATETARFIGIPEEDRICLLCDLDLKVMFIFCFTVLYIMLYDIKYVSKMLSICDDYEKLENVFSFW